MVLRVEVEANIELDDIDLKLLHEAVLTMRLIAQQRFEVARMASSGITDGEIAFLKDKAERLRSLELRFLGAINHIDSADVDEN